MPTPDYAAWAEAFRQQHGGRLPWEDVARPGLSAEQSLAEHLVALEWSKRLGRAPTRAEWEAQHKQRWNQPGYKLPSVKELTGQSFDEFQQRVRGLASSVSAGSPTPPGVGPRRTGATPAEKLFGMGDVPSKFAPPTPTTPTAPAAPVEGDDTAIATFIAKNKANLVETNPNWQALVLEFAKLYDPESVPKSATSLSYPQFKATVDRIKQLLAGIP